MRTYAGFLEEQSIDTLERWLNDALTERDYLRDNGASPEELAEANEHIRELRSAINEKY